ncbi:MAG: site-specific integrase [Steroidobacteraceae bacterium]|nr:site-specific integrase [Steroidobacteraceae bacterium]
MTRLGMKASHTWEEAVLRWLEEKGHKASIKEDRRNFVWLHTHLCGKELSAIDRATIDDIVKARRSKGVANATVNRTLALLRAVLRAAEGEWEWIERAPKVRLLPEAKGRDRTLTRDEAARLLAELPEHLRVMAAFALLTGARQRNVRELQWSQVDLERGLAWIHPDQAKAGRGIALPLTGEAVQLLRSLQGRHAEYVFTYRGQPLRYVRNTAWRSALRRAGIGGFRWHDLRHTWASWHAEAGTPMHVLRELGGWASDVMVRRYAHLSPGHLSAYVQSFGEQVRLQPGDYDSATKGGATA